MLFQTKRSTVNRQTGFTTNVLLLGRDVLQPIDLMLHTGVEEIRRTPGKYAARHQELQSIWSGPWSVTQLIPSVLYRIANCKRSMVAHHYSLKLCSDRDLPIWLLRNHHELRGTLGKYIGDRVLDRCS